MSSPVVQAPDLGLPALQEAAEEPTTSGLPRADLPSTTALTQGVAANAVPEVSHRRWRYPGSTHPQPYHRMFSPPRSIRASPIRPECNRLGPTRPRSKSQRFTHRGWPPLSLNHRRSTQASPKFQTCRRRRSTRPSRNPLRSKSPRSTCRKSIRRKSTRPRSRHPRSTRRRCRRQRWSHLNSVGRYLGRLPPLHRSPNPHT